MANPSTPNGIFSNPEVDSPIDENIWGGILNSNANIADALFVTRDRDYEFANFKINNARVQDASEPANDLGNVTGALVVDYEDGHYQYATLTGNITSLTINNFPASGDVGFISIEFNQDGVGGHTIDLTGGTYFSSFGALSLGTTANAKNIIRFETRDAGTTINAFVNEDLQVIT